MALGTPIIVPSLHATGRAVQLSITVTGATANTVVTVRRIVAGFDSGGEPRFYVRGFRNASISGGILIGYDVDFPQNASLAYVATCTDGSTTKTSSVSATIPAIDLGGDFIMPTTTEAGRVPVIVGALEELVRPARVEVMKPIGRRDPVAVGDRRGYPEFDLTLWTTSMADQSALETYLMAYNVVTFSPRYPTWVSSINAAMHIAPKDVREQRPSHLGVVPERRWVVSCQQVGAPATPMVTTIPGGW